jgi:hypothetical protein
LDKISILEKHLRSSNPARLKDHLVGLQGEVDAMQNVISHDTEAALSYLEAAGLILKKQGTEVPSIDKAFQSVSNIRHTMTI